MSSEDILSQLKETYLSNIPNHLEEMENLILSMEKGENYQENFEALYRKAHSLKGSGGTYGFSIITSICHQMEDYIGDTMRDSTLVNKHTINNIFKYIDILKDTYTLLLNGNDDFSEIEAKLKNLKSVVFTHEINGLLVGSTKNMYEQICMKVFETCNAHCTTIDNGMGALQRLLHEHFDFIVTSRENPDLSGPALIAALKLNQRKGSRIKTILITSNSSTDTCDATKPDFIIAKDRNFDHNLSEAINKIKESTRQ
ncbi:MAG: Hpt domain-containing protein [Gammaproteobacteria bacterium]|nr:Hpt domain-containing protein [Gammaproteobacteria bacterium]